MLNEQAVQDIVKEVVAKLNLTDAGTETGMGIFTDMNEAIAAALSDGSMDKFVAEANELSVGNVYEGLLDENGKVAEG